jgi:hypothetical protein
MKPYLIEGLDCSGKKTAAAMVKDHFDQAGLPPVTCYIGPLVRSPLRMLDASLTHLQRKLARGEVLDVLRRSVYLAGPVVDGLFFRTKNNSLPLKISSHYRAQARAMIEHDQWMLRWFDRTKALSISFGGCTYLTTSFQARIERHRQDVSRGATNKREEIRFLNYAEDAFEEWDRVLWQLLCDNIASIQTISTTNMPLEVVVEQVIRHIMSCREQGVIP